MRQPQVIALTTALVLLGTAVYIPGLSGGYIFDDYPNIIDNPALQPDTLSLNTLISAAVSSDSGVLSRSNSRIS
jgi:protein O-mannosyl-transferase